MAFISGDAAAATSLSLPTFQEDDIAIVLAIGSTPPSLPGGWTSITSATSPMAHSVGFRRLLASDTTTGTWTNATTMCVAVYRGALNAAPVDASPLGDTLSNSSTSSSSITWPVNPSTKSSSTSVVVATFDASVTNGHLTWHSQQYPILLLAPRPPTPPRGCWPTRGTSRLVLRAPASSCLA